MTDNTMARRVSDCCFQRYRGENKLIFNENYQKKKDKRAYNDLQNNLFLVTYQMGVMF